jgi:hypothetical protein
MIYIYIYIYIYILTRIKAAGASANGEKWAKAAGNRGPASSAAGDGAILRESTRGSAGLAWVKIEAYTARGNGS